MFISRFSSCRPGLGGRTAGGGFGPFAIWPEHAAQTTPGETIRRIKRPF